MAVYRIIKAPELKGTNHFKFPKNAVHRLLVAMITNILSDITPLKQTGKH